MNTGDKLVVVGCSGAGGPVHWTWNGQIISHGIGPAREIDAVSAFIMGKKSIEDLVVFTSACNPDISSEPGMELITIAAEQALQKIQTCLAGSLDN